MWGSLRGGLRLYPCYPRHLSRLSLGAGGSVVLKFLNFPRNARPNFAKYIGERPKMIPQ